MFGTNLLCPLWSLAQPVTDKTKLTLYSWEMYLVIIGAAATYFLEQATITKSMQYNTVGTV